jgi:cardiolipin synthase
LIRQIPNLLTVTRIALVPVVLRAIWLREFGWALAWCAVAGITDALDGFLARRLQARTRLGTYLDPVADKLLLSGTYLVLAIEGIVPWWITAVVFGRDLLILLFVAGAFLFTPLRDFPPSIWGKLCTTLQVLTAVLILGAGAIQAAGSIVSVALGLTVAATVWSAIHYLYTGICMLREVPVRNLH